MRQCDRLQSAEVERVKTDQQLTFDAHARACSRACYYQLRRIRQIRRFIDERSLRLLVHAFITSRLDYCNGLFANCSVAAFVNGFSEFRTALLVWYVQNLLLATLHHCCTGYTGYRLPGV